MIGLDKVIGKVLGEAGEDAARITAAAAEKCCIIGNDTEEKISKLRSVIEAEIETESRSIIQRADSAAVTEKRNIILAAKGEALDDAFEAAKARICGLEREEYENFVISQIKAAVEANRIDAQDAGCTVTFCERDRALYAGEIQSRLREEISDISFVVSEECAHISGGVLLDFGQTDVDCSVDVLISQERTRLEGRVCEVLFRTEK